MDFLFVVWLKFPIFLYSLLLPVRLTSSAPRKTSHSSWSPSPMSSWHKLLTRIKKYLYTHCLSYCHLSTHVNVKMSWSAVTQWWFSSFDCLKWNQKHFLFHRRSESDRHTCHKHSTSFHHTCHIHQGLSHSHCQWLAQSSWPPWLVRSIGSLSSCN